MRTIHTTLYEYGELSDSAKATARDWYRTQPDDCWWADYIYEDATTIAGILGIELEERPYKTIGGATAYQKCIWWRGFSRQGDGACFEGYYRYGKLAHKEIRKYAPKDEVLHSIADNLLAIQRAAGYGITARIKHRGNYCHEYSMDVECFLESDREFDWKGIEEEMRRFAKWIYRQLEQENDYQQSDEAVAETLEANDYEFLEYGSRA